MFDRILYVERQDIHLFEKRYTFEIHKLAVGYRVIAFEDHREIIDVLVEASKHRAIRKMKLRLLKL